MMGDQGVGCSKRNATNRHSRTILHLLSLLQSQRAERGLLEEGRGRREEKAGRAYVHGAARPWCSLFQKKHNKTTLVNPLAFALVYYRVRERWRGLLEKRSERREEKKPWVLATDLAHVCGALRAVSALFQNKRN